MKKTIKDRRGACVQAERKSSTSTLIPDLDNANVGNVQRKKAVFTLIIQVGAVFQIYAAVCRRKGWNYGRAVRNTNGSGPERDYYAADEGGGREGVPDTGRDPGMGSGRQSCHLRQQES